MIKISTISAKIKPIQAITIWFSEQSKKAVELYNKCLNLQFELANHGKKIYTIFELTNKFRDYSLGSDYKDRIFERVGNSTNKWIQSESLRYEIYWTHKGKNNKSIHKNKKKHLEQYPYLHSIVNEIEQFEDYKKHIIRLSRRQKLTGKPSKRKNCSLAFSIRKNRQETIQIKKNKIELVLPKFKGKISGKYNFLPASSEYQFKLATLKMDRCGTLWLKLTLEEKLLSSTQKQDFTKEKILVGVDMGLKTTRTAVAVHEISQEIVDIYNPERQRFFDKSYNALVWASNRDKRHLSFVHRKIARRRHDSIGKDIVKILKMGDIFKFGKPNAAFLLSGRLARSASDAANSMFLTRFVKRAELAGKEAGEVDESNTSVTCRKCSARRPMPLHVRTFECFVCGHTEDRDAHSAYQIAFRDFLSDDGIQSKRQKNQTKNGALSRRGMKPKSISLEDFQAQTPSQAPAFMREWG